MEEMNVRRIAVLLLLMLIASLGGQVWQFQNHRNATLEYREAVIQLRTDNQEQEADIEMYLAYIGDLEERITPDMVLKEQQRGTIRRFVSHYFTFNAGEEEARINNVAELVTDEKLEIIQNAFDESFGGNYHLSLTASNINIYTGATNEFIATFNVEYESDLTHSMEQVLVMRFIMVEDQISEFEVVSASEVFNFD